MAKLKQFNRAFFRDLWRLIKPYWSESEERWSARLLIALVIALNLLMVFISYRITEWYNTFWNALQGYNAPAAWHQLLVFLVLATPYVVAAVYQSYLASMLMIRWRRWLTNRYLDAWLARGTYYHMQLLGDGTDNPDQRISEDLSSFTSQTLNLAIGLLSSITTLVAFIAMLWKLSSQVALPWHGGKVVIPGYLVWAALVYSAIGTVIVALVGRPLIKMRFDQERFNADFRFSLVRLRENSESVALYRGGVAGARALPGQFRERLPELLADHAPQQEAELVDQRLRAGCRHLPRAGEPARLFCKGHPDRHDPADLQRLRPGPGSPLVHRQQLPGPGDMACGRGSAALFPAGHGPGQGRPGCTP